MIHILECSNHLIYLTVYPNVLYFEMLNVLGSLWNGLNSITVACLQIYPNIACMWRFFMPLIQRPITQLQLAPTTKGMQLLLLLNFIVDLILCRDTGLVTEREGCRDRTIECPLSKEHMMIGNLGQFTITFHVMFAAMMTDSFFHWSWKNSKVFVCAKPEICPNSLSNFFRRYLCACIPLSLS